MKFNFVITQTAEVSGDLMMLDLNKLEEYLNKSMINLTFGTSIASYQYGLELFSFNGEFATWFGKTKDIMKYSYKNKYLLCVSQVDWNEYKNQDKLGQFQLLKFSILESIDRLSQLERKPKDFQIRDFLNKTKEILTKYESELLTAP